MTNEEKIKKFDALEILRARIGGSYGSADGIFAGHPNDEGRAKEFRSLAELNQVSLDEIVEINLAYLYRKGYHIDHIKEQMKVVHKFYSKKLV